MNKDNQIKKPAYSIKSVLLGLSGILLLVLGFYFLPNAVYTMKQNNERKLPIYCVDSSENKVAISFDAAWGNGCLMEQKNIILESNCLSCS